MTEITSTRLIPCPPMAAYGSAKKVEMFPSVLPDLDKVEILEDNGNGQVTFYLNAGTYYVWRHKAGWNFSNPDTEIIS